MLQAGLREIQDFDHRARKGLNPKLRMNGSTDTICMEEDESDDSGDAGIRDGTEWSDLMFTECELRRTSISNKVKLE